MPYPAIDLARVKTFPLPDRQNRVALDQLVLPETPAPDFHSPDLDEVVARMVAARRAGHAVIWMMGAHLVKRGLSPLLVDLLEQGVITHLASNGAAAIHDFEIALQGGTSEDVLAGLEDGSFGMAEETGRLMNGAIREGARDGLGMGEALGRMIGRETGFPYCRYSLLHTTYRLGIPYTVHVALGTDIIHQHPQADFAAIGWASGQDFKIFAGAVLGLEGGVFCNAGSAVIGPEVFLKALSIARNLNAQDGLTGAPRAFTTANFDLVALGDYRRPVEDDAPEYYYRPRKNVVNRPVSLGGKGFHITGDHRVTIPNLHHGITESLAGAPLPTPGRREKRMQDGPSGLVGAYPAAAPVFETMLQRYPELNMCAGDLARAFSALIQTFRSGGTLFLCGNGGSMADALHIAGELDKSFRLPRRLRAAQQERFKGLPQGEALAEHLQQGLRAVPLGANPALSSAIGNDTPLRDIVYAQELYALGRPGDALLCISTSGKAQNVRYAATTARALGMMVIALTGPDGRPLVEQADIAIRAPGQDTPDIQSWHIQLYHTLCDMLEAASFSE